MAGSAYSQLPESLRENLKPLSTPREQFVKNFIDDAIGEHSDRLFLQMKRKPLMVDPYPKTKLRKRHRSLGLSANQKKELGIGALHKDKQRYENFVPLNKLWTDYMQKLLGVSKHSNLTIGVIENKILKADYHGAIFKVTKSKCSSYVGATGIVIKETKNMFYLITEDDAIRGIPKYNSLFEFQLVGYVFEIFGSNFRFRPGERSARKFKTKTFMKF